MVPELIEKYVFLVQTFVEAGDTGLQWQEVQRKWENRFGEPYARRSFCNHREAVESVFGIAITCDRSTNCYRINSGESAVDQSAATNYLINTFTVNSLLTLGKERLSGRVSVEDIPSGQLFLIPIMRAMLDGEVLKISYKKYMSSQTESRVIHPYALKESEKRWYAVSYSLEANDMRVFSLDRIVKVERTGETFRMEPSFDVDEIFENSYGIYLPHGEKPVLVKIRTTLRESAYLEDLPLHPSQIKLSQDGDSCIYAMTLIPNPGFVMELCKRGNRVEVLEPLSLREMVKDELKKALNQYEV